MASYFRFTFEGFRHPGAAVAFAVLVGFVAADLLVDYGGSNKIRSNYHVMFHKTKFNVDPVQADPMEIVAIVVGIIATIGAVVNRSFDDFGQAILAGGLCVFKRLKVAHLFDQLEQSQGNSYVGYEKYITDYLDNIRFMDCIMGGVMLLALLSQFESLRVSEVRRKMTLSCFPGAATCMCLLAGVVVKALVVDTMVTTWKSKAYYYRDLSKIEFPFNFGTELIVVLGVLGALMNLRSSPTVMTFGGLICFAGFLATEFVLLRPIISQVGDLKSVAKADREKHALVLLADVKLWHLVQLAVLLVGAVLLVQGGRFVRKLTQEEITEFKKIKAEKQSKALEKKVESLHIKPDGVADGRDGKSARARKMAKLG